ncbi:MAG: hypothetical protein RL095_889 [Verrucomicrobiota bacterium]|jgi:hypothetical protein
MSTLIICGCLLGLFLVMARRKRSARPKPGLTLLALAFGLAAVGTAMYGVLRDEDGQFEDKIAAAACKVRVERSDFVATAFKGRLAEFEKTVFLFHAGDSEPVVRAQAQAFLEKSGCPQSHSIERLHPQPVFIRLSELKGILRRHPGKVLVVSFCGLPSSNQESAVQEFWAEPSDARFLVCEALATEIDTVALENDRLLGWCFESFKGGRHFQMVRKENCDSIREQHPMNFSGALELPESGEAGEALEP